MSRYGYLSTTALAKRPGNRQAPINAFLPYDGTQVANLPNLDRLDPQSMTYQEIGLLQWKRRALKVVIDAHAPAHGGDPEVTAHFEGIATRIATDEDDLVQFFNLFVF